MEQPQNSSSTKRPVFVKIENYDGTQPIRIVCEEPRPVERLRTINAKLPEPFNIKGIITAPTEWLEKRVGDFDHHNARVEVDREAGTIKLILNERNCHGGLTDPEQVINNDLYNEPVMNAIFERSTVTGSIQYSEVFRRLHINEEGAWVDPQKLAAFFRLNRSIFPSIEDAMKLTSLLKNLKVKINADYEKKKDTFTGSRTEFYMQNVEHNLPQSFDITIPIYKGNTPEKYNIEFDVEVVDGNILLQLKSPAINDEVEKTRDDIFERELSRIRELAPELVIIEM